MIEFVAGFGTCATITFVVVVYLGLKEQYLERRGSNERQGRGS